MQRLPQSPDSQTHATMSVQNLLAERVALEPFVRSLFYCAGRAAIYFLVFLVSCLVDECSKYRARSTHFALLCVSIQNAFHPPRLTSLQSHRVTFAFFSYPSFCPSFGACVRMRVNVLFLSLEHSDKNRLLDLTKNQEK